MDGGREGERADWRDWPSAGWSGLRKVSSEVRGGSRAVATKDWGCSCCCRASAVGAETRRWDVS